MTRKLLVLTALLVLTILASWAPHAEAIGGCSASFCASRPPSTKCGCPPGTDFPGKSVTCGSWNLVGGCWAE
jgi:hypothetical protein